ncbi:macrophage migration inhibitory factor homolog [Rhopilema esculentum]|uniref:macrophage migration inhibitory factor homolog n=1 Tax=Rhopilema esculentum TaxID=499914 RepID=UPI0031D48794|eukprot:gene15458-6709_t
MPTFTVETNVSQKDFPQNWHKEATDLIANILSKPVQYVLVQSFPDVNMTFAGTTEPCASVKLTSIGGINEKANRGHVTTITEFIERTLKVPRDRMYINFFDGRRDMIGWNNKLFA